MSIVQKLTENIVERDLQKEGARGLSREPSLVSPDQKYLAALIRF